jgi:hypothetical protein
MQLETVEWKPQDQSDGFAAEALPKLGAVVDPDR